MMRANQKPSVLNYLKLTTLYNPTEAKRLEQSKQFVFPNLSQPIADCFNSYEQEWLGKNKRYR